MDEVQEGRLQLQFHPHQEIVMEDCSDLIGIPLPGFGDKRKKRALPQSQSHDNRTKRAADERLINCAYQFSCK